MAASNDKQSVFLRPTLVIGLGGTGAKIALEAKARMEEVFGGSGYNKAIKFLSFDTANENLQTTWPNHPDKSVRFSPEQEFVRISDVPLHDLMQSRDTNPAIGAILPEILQSTQIDQGAQQVRRLGRVALFYHYPRVREKLTGTISDLRDVRVMGKIGETDRHNLYVRDRGRLRVFILCSICGGTGSGIFLDMAYLVRHVAKNAGVSDVSAVDVVGMLLLPEVFYEIASTGWERIRANAYAALLDLEYYNQPRRADEALYQVDFPGEQVHVKGAPFSLTYLVSSSGKESTLKGLTDLAPLLGEALYNLTASRLGEQLDATLDNIRGSLSRYFRGYRAFYSALGIAQLVYPREWLRRRFITQMKTRVIRERIRASSAAERQNAPREAERFAARMRNIIDDILQTNMDTDQVTRSLKSLRSDVQNREDAITELQKAYREALSQHQQQVVAQASANRQAARQKVQEEFNQALQAHVDAGLVPATMGTDGAAQYRGLQWTIEWLNYLRNAIQMEATETMDPNLLLNQEVSRLMERMGIPLIGSVLVNQAVRQATVRLAQHISNDLYRYALDQVRQVVLNDFQSTIDMMQNRIIQMDLQWQNTLFSDSAFSREPDFPRTTRSVLSPADITRRIDQQVDRVLQDEGVYTALHDYWQSVLQANNQPQSSAGAAPGLSAGLFDVSHEQMVSTLNRFAESRYAMLEGERDVSDIVLGHQTDDGEEAFLDATEARTMVGTLGQQAHPLLTYSEGMLQSMRPFEIQVLAAVSKERARQIRELGLDEMSDLSEVETLDPTTITLLSTRHGIPVIALNHFDEDYRRCYLRLKQDPTTLMHLDKERELNPYDPGSRFFVNLEDVTTYFARSLAYGWIYPAMDDDENTVYAYQRAFFKEMADMAGTDRTRLENEINTLNNQRREAVDGSYERLRLDISVEQREKQLREIRIFLDNSNATPDNEGVVLFSYMLDTLDRPQISIARTLDEALHAVEASPMRRISYLFLQTMYSRLRRDPRAGETFTIAETQRLEQVETFLQQRGFVVSKSGDDLADNKQTAPAMKWSQPGQPAHDVEMRMASVLVVYQRIARHRQRSRRLPAGYLLRQADVDYMDGRASQQENPV